MRIFGVDISRYQRGISFEALKKSGVEFVIIKASQSNFSDPEFNNHYENAKKHGFKVGAFHYLTAGTVAEAIQEAKNCISVIKGKCFEMPIFLDIEAAIHKKLSKPENNNIITAFCLELEKAGYWAGFYCNYDFYKNYCSGADLAKRFSFWLASWSNTIPIIDNVQMWQFGGETNYINSNAIGGIVVDQDYCYFDYLTAIKNKGLNGYNKTVENPPAYDEYIVKPGDSLWKIAEQFYKNGAKFGVIATANNIKEPYIIHVGNILKIPKE